MNIEEERKAFEGYVLSLRKYKKRSPKFIFDLDENGDYDNQDIYELHHAWQASANREGFILVPKEPTSKMIKKGHDVFIGAFDSKLNGGQSLHCAYLAMVRAAQEQSND